MEISENTGTTLGSTAIQNIDSVQENSVTSSAQQNKDVENQSHPKENGDIDSRFSMSSRRQLLR